MEKNNIQILVLLLNYIMLEINGTVTLECGTEIPLEDLSKVRLQGCDEPECILKQGTTVLLEIDLTPNRNISQLINSYSFILFNVLIPVTGIDGTNACNNIYDSKTSNVGCPLHKDDDYVYRNSINILSIYPRVSLVLRVALREGNDVVFCTDIPAKIRK